MPVLAAAQQTAPEVADKWVAEEGARADIVENGIVVRRGTVRTARLYSDFVVRFEFRQLNPESEGRVLVRSRFGYGTSERGYRVALTRKQEGVDALGRISGAEATLKETTFTPAQLSGSLDEWQACEIRAERGQLTVRVNGEIVNSAEGLDEFTGFLALQANRGAGIEFRAFSVVSLPSGRDPFGGGARRANEPGIVGPRAIKSAKPFYPPEPHARWIQGAVLLEAVVESDGSVGDVRVVKPLHPDLDQAAMAAARQWQFSPATSDGQPTPVIVTIEISFKRTQ
jgi:TonB family protein